jgi:PAS domain S-box-containing protein
MSNLSLPTRSHSALPEQAHAGTYGRLRFLPIAAALCAGAIFVTDTFTPADIAFYTLYTAVVLMAARFCSAEGIIRVAAGCVALTILSHYLAPPGGPQYEGIVNTGIGLAAIGLTALLAVQQKTAENKLQIETEERARQANLLDLTYDAILVRDMNAVITYWNRGAEQLYGWSPQQAIGKRSHELFRTVFPAPLVDIEAELLRTGRWEGELKHTKPDGSRVVVLSRWSLRRDERGLPAAILETNNDITSRKRREEEIERLNQTLARRSAELAGANKELEAFTYTVSHDLRAPLRHVVGYSELLRKQASSLLDEKSRRYMQTILGSSIRMGNLIDDLLAFSSIGRAETKRTPVSLDQLVKEAVTEIGQDTRGRDIAWKIHPLPVCYGDRSMLKLVILNLLSNAVKFTGTRAQAEIEIGCVDGENEVEAFVRDNGAGFDMQYVNKLFGVFQRLHLPEQFEGTGIGLATVQRIIHRHGGKVRAEGGVDQGATFYFSLPKAHDAAERTANTL